MTAGTEDTEAGIKPVAGLVPGAVANGRYRIVRALGAGGMGEVFEAEDLVVGSKVALKALRADRTTADSIERMRREIALARKITHTNACRTHDLGDHEGRVFLTMELLPGKTLADRIAYGPLSIDLIRAIAAQLCAGLAAVHAAGVIHRDFKSANVVLVETGERVRAVVTDFGLARAEAGESGLTGDATLVGTASYMAPEQVEGKPATVASDIYALGVVLFELVTGHVPFRGETPLATATLRLSKDPPSPRASRRELPPDWDAAILKCLAKKPEDRFASVDEVAAVFAPSPAPIARSRARPRGLWSIAAAIVIAAGIVGFALTRRSKAPSSPKHPVYERVTFRRGTVTAARFAPDGSIVYTAAWDGAPPATFRSLRGSPTAQLLFAHGLLSIARDNRVALLAKETTLALSTLTGDEPQLRLEGVDEADWIPSSDELAITRHAGTSTTLEFPIGKQVHATTENLHTPRVSPDGARVAVLESRNYALGVTVIERSGATKRALHNWRAITGLAWSPTGKEIWVSGSQYDPTATAIFAVTLDGTSREVLRTPTPLSLHDIDASGRLLITQDITTRNAVATRDGVSRDLSWFDSTDAYSITDSGDVFLFNERDKKGCTAYVRRLDGAPATKVYDGCAMGMAPDGSRALVFDPKSQYVPGKSSEQMLVVPVGPGDARPLPRGPLKAYSSGAFSPDGRHVVLEASEKGEGERRVYVQDLEGGEPRAVAPVDTGFPWVASPASPDGKRVFGRSPSGWKIFLVDGGDARDIPGLQPGEMPIRWSTDRQLLLTRHEPEAAHFTIHSLDLESGARQQLHDIAPRETTGLTRNGRPSTVVITPDGKTYIQSFDRTLSQLFVVENVR